MRTIRILLVIFPGLAFSLRAEVKYGQDDGVGIYRDFTDGGTKAGVGSASMITGFQTGHGMLLLPLDLVIKPWTMRGRCYWRSTLTLVKFSLRLRLMSSIFILQATTVEEGIVALVRRLISQRLGESIQIRKTILCLKMFLRAT